MNLAALSNQLQTLVDNFVPEQFIYDVLLAYEQSKSAITRLKKGNLNLARNPNNSHDIIWKKKLYFKPVHLDTDFLSNASQDIHQFISDLNADPATHVHQPRLIIVMNAAHMLAIDTKTHDTLDIALSDLPHTMSGFNSLDDIFNDDDEHSLLDVKPCLSLAQSMDARLLEGFVEINEFYRAYQREPDARNGMSERKLFKRLEALRADAVKCAALAAHDVFHLLMPAAVVSSLADIFEDDDGLLDDGADLFELKYVTLDEQQRAQADFVARRKPCKKFADYEAQFKQVQKDLLAGKRKLLPFTDAHLVEGTFYDSAQETIVLRAHSL